MKKIVLALSLLVFVASACSVRDEMARLNERVDAVEEESAALAELQMLEVKKAIDEFRILNDSLTNYVTYVDGQLSELEKTEDENFISIQSALDNIDTRNANLSKSIVELQAIVDGIESRTPWMNEINMVLDRLAEANIQIKEIEVSVDGLSSEIATLSSTVSGHTDAISALNTKTDNLSTALDACNLKIESVESSLKEEIAALKKEIESISASVQSIAVVPGYSDGSVKFDNITNNSISFEIRPHDIAKKLAAIGPDAFSIKAYMSLTKAVGETCDLPISSVSYNSGTDLLDFTVDGTNEKLAKFYSGESGANARLLINYVEGNVDKTSAYFPLFTHVPVSAVSLEQNVSINVSEIYQFVPKLTPSNGEYSRIYWKTRKGASGNVALTVSSSGGIVTGQAEGDMYVDVYVELNSMKTITASSLVYVKPSQIYIEDFTIANILNPVLIYGGIKTISIINISPENATEKIKWNMDNSILKYEENDGGGINVRVQDTYMGHDFVTVKAYSYNVEKTCQIEVYSPETIEITANGVDLENLKVGDAGRFIATVQPEYSGTDAYKYKKVIWNSSNTKVISIDDAMGNFSVKSVGTTKITATSDLNKNVSSTIEITVRAASSSDGYDTQDDFNKDAGWE